MCKERVLDEYNIQGFEMLGKNIPRQNEKGLLIYSMVGINFVNIYNNSSFREYICLKITNGAESFIFASVYKAPIVTGMMILSYYS